MALLRPSVTWVPRVPLPSAPPAWLSVFSTTLVDGAGEAAGRAVQVRVQAEPAAALSTPWTRLAGGPPASPEPCADGDGTGSRGAAAGRAGRAAGGRRRAAAAPGVGPTAVSPGAAPAPAAASTAPVGRGGGRRRRSGCDRGRGGGDRGGGGLGGPAGAGGDPDGRVAAGAVAAAREAVEGDVGGERGEGDERGGDQRRRRGAAGQERPQVDPVGAAGGVLVDVWAIEVI